MLSGLNVVHQTNLDLLGVLLHIILHFSFFHRTMFLFPRKFALLKVSQLCWHCLIVTENKPVYTGHCSNQLNCVIVIVLQACVCCRVFFFCFWRHNVLYFDFTLCFLHLFISCLWILSLYFPLSISSKDTT